MMGNWDPILISIQFQIGIIALAVPILLQVIVNLDQRYNSRHIIHLFKDRPEIWVFGITLIFTLIHIGFWLLQNTYSDWKLLTPELIVYTEGAIPSLLVIQVVWLLLLVRKVVIFYVPDLFMNFLKKIGIQDEKSFYAFADLMYSTVDRGEPKIALEGSKLFLETTNLYSSKIADRSISFRTEHYEFNLKLIYRLIKSDNYELTFLGQRAIGGFWFFEIKENKDIHEDTYHSLWRGVTLALDKNRSDLATYLWERMYRHTRRIFTPFQAFALSFWINDPSNEEIEFSRLIIYVSHVNAYALRSRSYSVLKHAFDYTLMKPYRYILLPEDMTGVFQLFLYSYEDEYDYMVMRGNFYFPSSRGIKGEDQVKIWLRKYAALLFLRQYIVSSNYTSRSSLDYPELPEDQSKKRQLLDSVDFFEKLVNDIRADDELLNVLEFSHITDEWCTSKKLKTPKEFFIGFKEYLQSAFVETEQSQEISPIKHVKFIETTTRILKETDIYLSEFTADYTNGDVNNYNIPDFFVPFQRNAFIENIHFDHGNFDSFSAETYSSEIKRNFVNSFHIEAKERLKVSNEIVFDVIDELVDDRDRSDFVIVNAGVFLGFLIRVLRINELTEESYKKIPILNLNFGSNAYKRTLFLMLRSDLPALTIDSPEKKLIKKLGLLELDVNDKPIYGNVIDFKNREELRNEYIPDHPNPDRMIMAYMAARYEFSYRKDARIIALEPLHKKEEKEKGVTLEKIDYDFFNKK